MGSFILFFFLKDIAVMNWFLIEILLFANFVHKTCIVLTILFFVAAQKFYVRRTILTSYGLFET